ncbi:MAG: DUF4175 family protein [Planctomycetota bacterium]|jgi:hypothetical protein
MEIFDLQARIGSMRGSIRRLFFLDGVGKVLLTASVVILFLFVADYTLILPGGARLVLFLLGLVGVGVAFSRYLAYPLRAPITDDDVVLSVERAHPELKEALISALQFSRHREDEVSRQVMSPAMVDVTVSRALKAAAPLSFSGILAPRKPLGRFALGAIGAVALLVLGMAFPETTAIFLNRVYGGATEWPARTHIVMESPQSEKIRIAAGEDLLVKVRILGVIPSRVWVNYRFFETDERGEARMTKVGDDSFQFFFSRLVSPLRVRIEAGDATPRTFEVEVLQPPRVKAVYLWITPPPYTKAPPTPVGNPITDGNIRAPVGSRARLRVEVSKPIESVRMVYQQPPGKFKDIPRVGTHAAEIELDVLLDERYTLKITDTEGLQNRTPSRFSIRAMKDRRPRISVEKPETTSLWITPQATLPFQVQVKDDFGVNTVTLSIVRGSREHGPQAFPLPPTPPLAEDEKWGRPVADYTHTIDFPSLEIPGEKGKRKIEEGDMVLVLLEATDFRAPKPNRTPSAEYRFTVVSRGKLERLVEERMIQIKDTLRKARDGQDKVRIDLLKVRGVLETEEMWDSADREALLSCQTGQRTVAQRLSTAAREFERILSIVLINKLGDPEYVRKIEDMGGITRHLATERCPNALTGMDFARRAETKDAQRKGLTESLQIQADIIQALEDLLARMEKWEDYNEVIKIVREIREFQDALYRETLDKAKEQEKKD